MKATRRAKLVTLYGKPGCHLCEDARKLLDGLRKRYAIELSEVDITSDAELFRRYDIIIPVIVIDGSRELHVPIDEGQLKKALRD